MHFVVFFLCLDSTCQCVHYWLTVDLGNISTGVMQSPISRLVLSTLFISDFDEGMFIKLALDTRLGGIANLLSDLFLSQGDLDSLK